MRVAAVATAALVAFFAVAACGDAGTGDRQVAAAHPFAVDAETIPSDYELVAVGSGTAEPEWDAEMGSDEPLTVLEIDGAEVHASVVAWEPMESELRWASRSGDTSPDVFVLDDGRPAAFGEGTDGAWSDLVIEVGDTEALMIAAEGATRDELVGYAAHLTSGGDRTVAPAVQDPPDGWAVRGSVGVDAMVAMRAGTQGPSNEVPGPGSSYAMGWIDTRPVDHEGPAGSLTVMVLPGDAADLDALASTPRRGAEPVDEPVEVDVDGRAGVLVPSTARYVGGGRTLFLESGTGAYVVVTANGSHVPEDDELIAIAASVREVDAAQWDAAQAEAFGGAELVADDGEAEIARGEVDGIEWLLQTKSTVRPEGAVGATGPDSIGPLPRVAVMVDDCLKLSNRQRACSASSIAGSNGWVSVWNDSLPAAELVDFPPFVLVATSNDAAEVVRVRTGSEELEGRMWPVPEGYWVQRRAGVVFGSLSGGTPIATCHPDPPEPPAGSSISAMRIDLLDAAGVEVGCVGM